jgi:hypothetical protein
MLLAKDDYRSIPSLGPTRLRVLYVPVSVQLPRS